MKPSFLLTLLLGANLLHAQNKLFLNCPQGCFEDFLRQDLNYFDFVRDRFLGDFQILINTQPTGNGGFRFNIRLFNGSNKPLDSLAYVTRPAEPDAEIRVQVCNYIKILLVRHIKNKDFYEKLQINIPKRSSDSLSHLRDPWRYWVFSPEVNGWGEGESNYYMYRLAAVLNVRKITEKHRFTLNTEYNNRAVAYRLADKNNPRGNVTELRITPLYAYSVSEHVSLGAVSRLQNEQFRNIRYHISTAPLVEYNFYPYSQNISRQLRWVNQAGGWYNQYYFLTVNDKMQELRYYYRTSLIADANQPWGSVQAGLHFNFFMDRPQQHRAFLNLNTTLRMLKGLSLRLQGQVSYIKDQISLVKEPFDDTVYILYLQQLPTLFNFWSEFGVVYTFGSIHNTIVNPRFGQVD